MVVMVVVVVVVVVVLIVCSMSFFDTYMYTVMCMH